MISEVATFTRKLKENTNSVPNHLIGLFLFSSPMNTYYNIIFTSFFSQYSIHNSHQAEPRIQN